MATTMCLSGAALLKAGANVSTTLSTTGGDNVNSFINQAESRINVATRYNWTDVYASLNDDVKKILEDYCASLAGISCVLYDMSGYTSRGEAEDIINTLRDNVLIIQSILMDKKQEDFINGAT